MPYAGEFSPVDSGEQIPMQLDFASDVALVAGDSIANCAGAVQAYLGTDPNAAALAAAAAQSSGTIVTQYVGPAFIPGVTYQWNASITTAKGAAYTLFARFLCANPQAPSALATTPASPGTTIHLAAPTTISQPGIYVLSASATPITMPASWPFAQGVTIAAAPTTSGQVISGPIAGGALTLYNVGQSTDLIWDSTLQEFLPT